MDENNFFNGPANMYCKVGGKEEYIALGQVTDINIETESITSAIDDQINNEVKKVVRTNKEYTGTFEVKNSFEFVWQLLYKGIHLLFADPSMLNKLSLMSSQEKLEYGDLKTLWHIRIIIHPWMEKNTIMEVTDEQIKKDVFKMMHDKQIKWYEVIDPDELN